MHASEFSTNNKLFLTYQYYYQISALTYNYRKQELQNACKYKTSRTLSDIHNNVAGLHRV